MAFSPETYALLLKKLEEGGGGGGSGLPSVTAADNGKVLSVVNGAWAAALYSSYDAVITLDVANDNGPSLIHGSFSSVLSKLNNNIPIFTYCWGFSEGSGAQCQVSNIEIDGDDIVLMVKIGADTWNLLWHDDNTVEWD